MVYEKARKGDLNITDALLRDLADFVENHLAGSGRQEFSLICPESKFLVRELAVIEDGLKAGEKAVDVGRVRFLISSIQPRERPEKPKPLKAKEFALYHAGIYDKDLILSMPWEQYRPFVLQLFGVRVEPHSIHGLTADGYVGLHSAYLWDYPNHPELVLDRGYVESLHSVMKGRGGDRFYLIAPGAVMAFMEDEIPIEKTTYVILKVPLSVLMALIERGEVGSLKQPTGESGVNEVIDAVGYDFISQPVVKAQYTREPPENADLFNHEKLDYVIRMSDFRSNTLASDPEDFVPFETFSMALVDTDYDGKTFNLCHVFWADDTVNADRTEAVLRLTDDEVPGRDLMIIFMDKYGNELKVRKSARDFKGDMDPHKEKAQTGKRKP
jgi:site-specific DNA-methyltransferase (adenine-specific)/adenine-specific DNA-methyltransferase